MNLKTKYQKTTSEHLKLLILGCVATLMTQRWKPKSEASKMNWRKWKISVRTSNPEQTKEFVRLEKRIKLLIKKRYSFYGYTEFANLVDEMEKKDPSLSDTKNTELIQRRFHKMFSETVLIIDEAHNIKDTGGDSETKQPKILPQNKEGVIVFI